MAVDDQSEISFSVCQFFVVAGCMRLVVQPGRLTLGFTLHLLFIFIVICTGFCVYLSLKLVAFRYKWVCTKVQRKVHCYSSLSWRPYLENSGLPCMGIAVC